MAREKSVAVVGGGFVGLSTALLLRRAGHAVTLIEAAKGGALSASHGNAGTFAPYACVHINRPGLVWDVPRMLASSTGPLSLVASPHLLRMLPWFGLFLRHCRPDKVRASSQALGSLLAPAEAAYDSVWTAAGVHVDEPMGRFASGASSAASLPFSARHGYLLLQKTEAMMKASQGAAQTRRECVPGLRMEALTTAEVLELEPNLSPAAAAGGAWFFPDGWFLREPGALLRALASGFEEAGGEARYGARATALRPQHDSVAIELDGDGGSVVVDEVVVAGGAHSCALAASIGDWIPLDTERGYHVEWEEGSEAVFTRAVCDPSQGYISSPMSGGLRSAGLVELGGTGAGPTPVRYRQLEEATRSMLNPSAAAKLGPRVKTADWLGFRPTMPDALPVIGRSLRAPRVVYAFGHQHIGWTLGGITGQLVTELIDGREPSVDLRPFRPDRFSLASLVK
jgi:glycine/D-amino acid oxidase-like deaminating enzyme|eukprot:Tamp_14484.p1 GENE.Tamp_14484~~Tamp_14484.p1  ORF type:complete len:455 (+),score=94.08 Tamp_14484:3-1367(+)